MGSNIVPRILTAIALIVTTFFHLTSSSPKTISMDMLEHLESLNLGFEVGPESLAFDPFGGGPYTGVAGGRILKWMGNGQGWSQFAVSPNHGMVGCEGSNIMMESSCGRPLGLQFHRATGTLYVADAYYGLLAVGPSGGAAVQLCNSAEHGGPFHFTNGVDVDQKTGVVYFTDSSTKFSRPSYLLAVILGDKTGRLMKYDPSTHKVTVLKHDLPFPNGVALSDDNTFLLMAETGNCRIIKYWLAGPKAGEMEEFAELPGYPDNIKRTANGDFWVGINRQKVELNNYENLVGVMSTAEHAVALRLSREGKVVQVLNGGMMSSVSEVLEVNGTIWVGSVDVPYVGVYRI